MKLKKAPSSSQPALHPNDIRLAKQLREHFPPDTRRLLREHDFGQPYKYKLLEGAEVLAYDWKGAEFEYENEELDNLSSEIIRLSSLLLEKLATYGGVADNWPQGHYSIPTQKERASDLFSDHTREHIEEVHGIASQLLENLDKFERAFRKLSPESFMLDLGKVISKDGPELTSDGNNKTTNQQQSNPIKKVLKWVAFVAIPTVVAFFVAPISSTDWKEILYGFECKFSYPGGEASASTFRIGKGNGFSIIGIPQEKHRPILIYKANGNRYGDVGGVDIRFIVKPVDKVSEIENISIDSTPAGHDTSVLIIRHGIMHRFAMKLRSWGIDLVHSDGNPCSNLQ